MSANLYRILARSALLREYEKSFHKATGVALKLVPVRSPRGRIGMGAQENAFCRLVATSSVGCAACRRTQETLLKRLGRKLTAQQLRCFAGVMDLAVPVVVEGRYTATLLGGHVLVGQPTARNFQRVTKQLARLGWDGDWQQLRRSYFALPVVTSEQMNALLRLLTMFAQELAEHANRWMITGRPNEPHGVAEARAYARAHLTERITLRAVAVHVHLSPYYFCHLFKKTAGVSFHEFLNRVRMEKAKELLADPRTRIGEVATACGFVSLSHFDRTFKRYTTQSPKQYRATQGA